MKKLITLFYLLAIPFLLQAQGKKPDCPPGWEKNPSKHPECKSLPVTLLSFKASVVEASVKLHWEFSEPVNHSHFLLEVSRDALNWQILAALPETKFTDHPECGQIYYRLSSVDLDGTIHTYQVIAAKVISCNVDRRIFSILGQQLKEAPTNQIYIKGQKKFFKTSN